MGETAVTTGAGLFAAKNATFEVPPPGCGFATVIESVVAVASCDAGIVAPSEPATYVVVTGELPIWTTEALTNPVPLTVGVSAAGNDRRRRGDRR